MFVWFFCIPFHVLCSADTQSETHLSPVSIGIEFAVYDVDQNIHCSEYWIPFDDEAKIVCTADDFQCKFGG